MEEFLILILVVFFTTNSLDKAESVQLFDEIFGEGWWDNEKDEEWNKLALEHHFHDQIDGQNTQLGQIEPNSTDQFGQIEPNSTDQFGQIEPNSNDQNPPLTESDRLPLQTFDELFVEGWWDNDQIDRQNTQLGQIEPNSTDQFGQIEPNSNDQNPPLTESDHFDKAKNVEEQKKVSSNENIGEDERKRKIIAKFHAMKDEFKQKGKYSKKEWTKIEDKIAKYLKANRSNIYGWKKEFGLSRKVLYEKEERQNLVEKFDQRKAELKRDGFKNSYRHEIDESVAKELGLNFVTICRWKSELGQTAPNKYPHSEQKELLKCYYEIKGKNPKISDADIAKTFKIGTRTLVRWKRQFKRQQLHPNSVDGHSVVENSAANVQEMINRTWGVFE